MGRKYPEEIKKQVKIGHETNSHAYRDIPALIEQHEQDQQRIAMLSSESQQNDAYSEIYKDICDKYGKNFRALLNNMKALQSDNATLKKRWNLKEKTIASCAGTLQLLKAKTLFAAIARSGTEFSRRRNRRGIHELRGRRHARCRKYAQPSARQAGRPLSGYDRLSSMSPGTESSGACR